MIMDPETMMRISATRREELLREAALHRQTSRIVPAWRRTTGRILHRLAHALLAAPSVPSPAPAAPCDDAPLGAL